MTSDPLGAADADARLFRVLLESAPDPIVIVDGEGRIVLVNDRVEELFGYARAELLGGTVDALVPDPHRAGHAERRIGFTAQPRRRPMGTGIALTARCQDGTEVPVDITLSPVSTERGLLVMAIVRDMTEQRAAYDRWRWLAEHDPMTGLANRSAFELQLDAQVSESARYGGGALLLIDLDGFKAHNDALGHAAGDDLLRRVATALRDRLRGTDVVARFGGDEFVALLPRADTTEALKAAHAVVEAVRQVGSGPPGGVTASVGVVLMGGGLDANGLLAAADAAMYEAKAQGGNTSRVFDGRSGP